MTRANFWQRGQHSLSAIVSVNVALVIGITLALVMNSGISKLPIRQYFDKQSVNAVWDWSNVLNHSDQELQDMSEHMYLHQINAVYVDIGVYANIMEATDNDDRQRRQALLEEDIRRYVNAMAKHGIKVYAAAGDTQWSKPDQQRIPLAIQQFVFEYNRNNPQHRLAGIQYDVESYNQEHFEEASFTEKSLVLLEFLDMVDRLADAQEQYVKGDDKLELGFAVPYWFDNQNQNIKSVEWYDRTGPVLYHVLDRLNSLPKSNIVVMAYRNAAQGNDGMVYHSRTEIEYARAMAPNVGVLVGIEVNDVEPAKITFYGRTHTEISSEVKKVQMEFSGSSSYRGIAINDLAGYQAIGETKPEE